MFVTLSVMSLSACSKMSRVRSLMVSRVMELFWRRCLREGNQTNLGQWSHSCVLLIIIRETICFTSQLSCWTVSYQHWREGENNRKDDQEVRKERGKRAGCFQKHSDPLSLEFSDLGLEIFTHQSNGKQTRVFI